MSLAQLEDYYVLRKHNGKAGRPNATPAYSWLHMLECYCPADHVAQYFVCSDLCPIKSTHNKLKECWAARCYCQPFDLPLFSVVATFSGNVPSYCVTLLTVCYLRSVIFLP